MRWLSSIYISTARLIIRRIPSRPAANVLEWTLLNQQCCSALTVKQCLCTISIYQLHHKNYPIIFEHVGCDLSRKPSIVKYANKKIQIHVGCDLLAFLFFWKKYGAVLILTYAMETGLKFDPILSSLSIAKNDSNFSLFLDPTYAKVKLPLRSNLWLVKSTPVHFTWPHGVS